MATLRRILVSAFEWDGIVGPTKSGRERKVPITESLLAALKSIRHARGPRVFCKPDGSMVKIGHLHEKLWGACRRAGLRRIRWHDLRHSFASQLVIAGAPLRQVQDVGLGGPSLVLITGKEKPFRTVLSARDYADVRRLGAEYLARRPRSVLR
jgi:hypothetical protein